LDLQWWYKDSHGLDPMVVGFTTTCTCEISAYHHLSCEFESHSDDVYLITFVSDLQ
jgi:alkyl hydroperoxide reductase subunit AhpC